MKRFAMCIIFTTLVLSVARPVAAIPIISTFGLASPAQTLTFDEVIFMLSDSLGCTEKGDNDQALTNRP